MRSILALVKAETVLERVTQETLGVTGVARLTPPIEDQIPEAMVLDEVTTWVDMAIHLS